ncbi:MAG: NUMOD4 domain-containing protein [Nanoarchaeota archaeon]
MDNEEKWKEITGFPNYFVSTFGRVKSTCPRVLLRDKIPELIKKQIETEYGYLRVGLWGNDKKHTISVHRLVAIAFIPNLNNLPQVNHLDGNKKNNHVTNLEWCTAKQNNEHSYEIGIRQRTELPQNQIDEILSSYKPWNMSQNMIAKKYGVSRSYVKKLTNNIQPNGIGKKNKRLKIDKITALAIKEEYNPIHTTHQKLAIKYNVSRSLIHRILNDKYFS